MITSIRIKGFRGVREGEISGFKNLNILVGRNATGKSTLLEAIYLVSPGISDVLGNDVVYRVCSRRGWAGVRTVLTLFYMWFKKRSLKLSFTIEVNTRKGNEAVKVSMEGVSTRDLSFLKELGLNLSKLACLKTLRRGLYNAETLTYIDEDAKHKSFIAGEAKERSAPVIFVDWKLIEEYDKPERLYSALTALYGTLPKKFVIETLRRIKEMKDVEDLELLITGDKLVLHAVYGEYSIPIYALSDGIKYGLISVLALSFMRDGIVLIEEPELHQHWSSLRLVCEAIIKSATERNNQIFISSHSLEFIDIMIDLISKYGLEDKIAFYRLSLSDGVLKSTSYSFDEVRTLRKDLEYDLRG